jgi:hypothetical protein
LVAVTAHQTLITLETAEVPEAEESTEIQGPAQPNQHSRATLERMGTETVVVLAIVTLMLAVAVAVQAESE